MQSRGDDNALIYWTWQMIHRQLTINPGSSDDSEQNKFPLWSRNSECILQFSSLCIAAILKPWSLGRKQHYNHTTKLFRVPATLYTYTRGAQFDSRLGYYPSWRKVLYNISHSLQANTGAAPKNRWRSFPFKPLPTLHSRESFHFLRHYKPVQMKHRRLTKQTIKHVQDIPILTESNNSSPSSQKPWHWVQFRVGSVHFISPQCTSISSSFIVTSSLIYNAVSFREVFQPTFCTHFLFPLRDLQNPLHSRPLHYIILLSLKFYLHCYVHLTCSQCVKW
jgi:hypothetical protein